MDRAYLQGSRLQSVHKTSDQQSIISLNKLGDYDVLIGFSC